jgi:chloramphenicol-sensitive protein RarD
MDQPGREMARGVRAGLLAYLIWGFLTVYWKQLVEFDPVELIGWRVLGAAAVMAVVVTVRGRWRVIAGALGDGRLLARITITALLLTANWGAYVYAVVNDRIIETALGYFIAPLGTMTIGIVALGERPSRAQRWAMALAAVAVVELTIAYGRLPLIALIIAASWALYGLGKRRIPLTGVDSFAAESFVLVVPAAMVAAVLAPGASSIPQSASAGELTLVAMAGIATAVPLSLFAFAAVRVPFTTLGPLQYLVPIVNFLLGWLVYDESLPGTRVIGFALVWIALLVVTLDVVRAGRPGPDTIAELPQPVVAGATGSAPLGVIGPAITGSPASGLDS